jgi:hypothetical protein
MNEIEFANYFLAAIFITIGVIGVIHVSINMRADRKRRFP